MFRKILYPTDFSEGAERALEYIKKLKDSGIEEVLILHVIHHYGMDSIMEGCEKAGLDPENFKKDFLDMTFKKEELKAEMILKVLKSAGLNGRIRIEFGKPSVKIIEISKDEHIDLIVMGANGEGKIEEFLLGSVTEKVIRHGKTPVLVVK